MIEKPNNTKNTKNTTKRGTPGSRDHYYQTDPKDGRCKICRKRPLDAKHLNRNGTSRRYDL